MADPQIEQTEDGYLVSLPVEDGLIRLAFEQVEQVRGTDLRANVTTWQEVGGLPIEPFSAPLRLHSNTDRESYRRGLDDAFGKGGWTPIISRACGMVISAYAQRRTGYCLEGVADREMGRYLLEPFTLEGLASVLFGRGEAGKSTIALAIGRAVCTGEALLGHACAPRPVVYLDYEADDASLKARLKRLGGVPSDFYYYPGGGIGLPDQLREVKRFCRKVDAGLLISDSAAYACGKEPERAEAATAYYNALSAIGVASLTIAHTVKTESRDSDRYPFGSIFWSLGARQTWYVQADDEDDHGDVMHLGLFNRKGNERGRRPPFGIRMEFNGGRIDLSQESIQERFEEKLGLKVRIRKLLTAQGKMTRAALAEALEATDATVRKTLQRMPEARSEGRSPHSAWYLLGDDLE